jgi:hypothetical protein
MGRICVKEDRMDAEAQELDDMGKITPLRGLALVAGLMWVAYFVMSAFDDKTQLLPDREGTLEGCLILGGFVALAAAILAITRWRNLVMAQRIVWPPAAALLGFLTVFMFSSTLADLVEGRIDFPAAKTKTFDGFLVISRAYWTHGRGQSWNIQTTPLWSNLEITQADYNFMLAHRPAGQSAENRDEIASRGSFCAHVTIQRTDKALRVLHAGRGKLPEGTVVLCPQR